MGKNDKKNNLGNKMNYTFDEHRYNFAVWTAARAIQRGLNNASSANIAKLFKKMDIVGKLAETSIKNENDFDTFQKKSCKAMINYAIKLNLELSYGRASKLLALFIKTYYILPENGAGNISKFAHPPIDNILLERSKKDHSIRPIPKWTLMEEEEYYIVINEFRKLKLESFWMLEKYWNVA
jgi:hypothetical protein